MAEAIRTDLPAHGQLEAWSCSSERDGKIVMYELTDRGRAILAVIAPSEATA
jgi:hypothetical protein